MRMTVAGVEEASSGAGEGGMEAYHTHKGPWRMQRAQCCTIHGERLEQCFICGWSAGSVSDIDDVDCDDAGDVPTRCQQITNLPGPFIVCGGVDHLCEIPEEECSVPLFCRRPPLDFIVHHYE